jgi:hypothetical protein
MNYPQNLKICYIAGILQRSGTNFLHQLIERHTQCIDCGPIEDFILHHSQLLNSFSKRSYWKWNGKSVLPNKGTGSEAIMENFGKALSQFLYDQSPSQFNTKNPPDPSNKPRILLTRTPSVQGIENFFDLFPDSYLVILVRDGRAVVESGVKTFQWKYEDAIVNWSKAAKVILDYAKTQSGKEKQFRIVRYEELVKNPEGELEKLFSFLGMDEHSYDFENIVNLKVYGSSQFRDDSSKGIDWKPKEKPKDFNPLDRFSHWPRKRHDLFNRIAGRPMEDLGYTLAPAYSQSGIISKSIASVRFQSIMLRRQIRRISIILRYNISTIRSPRL